MARIKGVVNGGTGDDDDDDDDNGLDGSKWW